MTNDEAIRMLTRLKDQINFEWTDAQKKMDALNVAIEALSAQPDSSFITWLLDKIWDEDMWELNWQAFPELVCRKLEKLGYVKRKGDEYERPNK